jgi:hypothetical protein
MEDDVTFEVETRHVAVAWLRFLLHIRDIPISILSSRTELSELKILMTFPQHLKADTEIFSYSNV